MMTNPFRDKIFEKKELPPAVQQLRTEIASCQDKRVKELSSWTDVSFINLDTLRPDKRLWLTRSMIEANSIKPITLPLDFKRAYCCINKWVHIAEFLNLEQLDSEEDYRKYLINISCGLSRHIINHTIMKKSNLGPLYGSKHCAVVKQTIPTLNVIKIEEYGEALLTMDLIYGVCKLW
jgi:hypothetical protein